MRVETRLHKLCSCVNGDKNFVAVKLQRYTKHNGMSHSKMSTAQCQRFWPVGRHSFLR